MSARYWSLLLVLTLLWVAPGRAAADTLYRFVGKDGVVHFSNVPNDPRFVAVRRLGKRSPTAAPRNITAYDDLIVDAATSHGVPAALVKAVVAAESNFDPRALSARGAQGLMQLMPQTAQVLRVSNAYDVQQNLEGGTRYLARMVHRYGDWARALAAYNAGPDVVDRYQGVPPFPETREYVRRVLSYYRRYDAEFAD